MLLGFKNLFHKISSMTFNKFKLLLLLTVILLSACNKSSNDPTSSNLTPTSEPSRWGRRADLLEANSEMSVAELDGQIYVLGGYPSTRISTTAVQVYDPATDKWRRSVALPVALNHTMSVSVKGILYVIGGQTEAGGDGPFVNTLYAFDPKRESWSTQAPMPSARSGGGAAVVNGRIYVAGGRPPRGNDFAVYDPTTNRWEILPNLPTQRNHFGMVSVGSKIYVIGGRAGAGFETPTIDKVEVYDVAAGSWSTATPMLKPRGGVNAIVANGFIHVFGGEGNMQVAHGVFPDHDVFDPVRNSWIHLSDMPTPVHGVTGATFLNDLIHLPGGGTTSGGTSGSTIHQTYRPASSYP
jgi:N-acetylneuraminic acid mutarotase